MNKCSNFGDWKYNYPGHVVKVMMEGYALQSLYKQWPVDMRFEGAKGLTDGPLKFV